MCPAQDRRQTVVPTAVAVHVGLVVLEVVEGDGVVYRRDGLRLHFRHLVQKRAIAPGLLDRWGRKVEGQGRGVL